MAKSGFGPYHGPWLDDAPTKPIGIIPTPWMMTRVLGFVEILQVHEELVLSLTVVFRDYLTWGGY
jgi:hypothetical protein